MFIEESMRINLYILHILILPWICIQLSGQGRFIPRAYIEAGIGVNLAYFDVGGGIPGISAQGGVLYDLAANWQLGANIGIHRARGTDAGTSNDSRGYEFRSNINEICAKGVYVIRFKPYPIKKWKTKWEPRIYACLGLLQFQPKPNVLLASQGNGDYLTVAPFFSGGLGIAYYLGRDLSLLFEGGGNTSTSDYLEGFSDPENLSIPDIYLTMLVKFIYKIPKIWQ